MLDRRTRIDQAVAKFITLVQHVEGVLEVALFGSVATEKAVPDDFDLMVFIKDVQCIPAISSSIRSITSTFHAHDVFLFDENRQYLGRVCHRKKCPALSVECKVYGCGKVKYLQVIEGFTFQAKQALAQKPVPLWIHSSLAGSISEQWFHEVSTQAQKDRP